MTRRPMDRFDRAQRWDLATAAVDRMRAAQMEMTSGRRRQRGGQLAAERLEADELIVLEHQPRDAVEQRAGIRMERVRVDVSCGADLDDSAEIHDSDAIR